MAGSGPAGDWYKDANNIDGLLLDIFGVLYDSGPGGSVAIPGSIEALKKLDAAGVPVRLCSNTSNKSKDGLAAQLTSLGFQINAQHVFTPIPAVQHLIKEQNLRPFLVLDKGVVGEFSDVNQDDPNCVVMGDAANDFSYENVNRAFQILIGSAKPRLITLGSGKYYKETDGMKLDVGSYGKALEYACGIQAEVVGKPAKSFFTGALNDMKITPERAVMIGDDIVSDIGGAQACGIKGVQVRTGKYRESDEPHVSVKPDGYVDNLLQAVDLFLKYKS